MYNNRTVIPHTAHADLTRLDGNEVCLSRLRELQIFSIFRIRVDAPTQRRGTLGTWGTLGLGGF